MKSSFHVSLIFFVTYTGTAFPAEQTETMEASISAVVDWTRETLATGDLTEFEQRIAWSNEAIKNHQEAFKPYLDSCKHLFRSLRSVPIQIEGLTPMEVDRLVWSIEIFRTRHNRSSINEEPWDLPISPSSLTDNENSTVWWGMVLALSCLCCWAWIKQRPTGDGFTMSNATQKKATALVRTIQPAKNNIELRAQISLMLLEKNQHPMCFHHPKKAEWKSLNPLEKKLVVLIRDGIPQEHHERLINRNRGTVYNMRSSIRKKLNIPEEANLTLELRMLECRTQ